jgi:hypothetical protein
MTAERSEAERAESDRRRLWQLAGLGLVAVVVIGIWIFSVTSGAGNSRPTGGSPDVYPKASIPPASDTSLTHAAAQAKCSLRTFRSYGKATGSGRVSYRTNPPTSGASSSHAAADGIYDDPVSTTQVTRALENGRVIVQFAPEVSERLRGQLKTLVNEDPRHTILTANQTDMPFAIAASAWRHYVGCNTAGPAAFDALRDFRTAYRDRAG